MGCPPVFTTSAAFPGMACQLPNAPGGLAKSGLQRIVLALLEAGIHPSQSTLVPLLFDD